MDLTHNTSRIAEILVHQAWDSYEPCYLYGAIDADKFMGHPRNAVTLLIAPYVAKKPHAASDATISKYVAKLAGLCDQENSAEDVQTEFLNLFKKLAAHLKEKYA